MTSVASRFVNQDLLTQALTHRSYCNEHGHLESNERLEFLGDSILSVIISDRLYRLLPNQPEGDLTSRRSYLVQTTSLAQKSKLLGLDTQLRLSRGEEDSGGRQNPSLLANTFEAVLGALFIDSGISSCYDFLSGVFPDDELISQDLPMKDSKSLLQELSQAHNWGTPTYTTTNSSGPDHAKKFTVSVSLGNDKTASGDGTSKQRAQNTAAQNALKKYFDK
jgi:ribonuclease-3